MPTVLYHVSPRVNRNSIERHGLDWRRMVGFGIAGSSVPEADGVYLARDQDEVDYFVRMGRGRADAIDVWEVVLDCECDVWADKLPPPFFESDEGYLCHGEPIAANRLRLLPQGPRKPRG